MASDILQKFLDSGLLDLGDGTDKFAYLEAAAENLAKTLKENCPSLIRSTSLLISPKLVKDEPVTSLCEDAIKAQWPTYRSRFPSDTNQLFRATLLQALAQVTEEPDCSYAAIVFYTSAGALPYLATERDEKIFREFLLSLGSRVESEADRTWARPKVLSLPKITYDGKDVDISQIDSKSLADALKNAAGQSGAATQNPHWPGANNAEWLNHFGKGSADGITAAVSLVLKDLVPKIVARARTEDAKVLGVVKGVLESANADDRRAELLYWKEALYSHKKKCGYRNLSFNDATYWVAYDLHGQVPRFHPHSVEFFLRETLRSAVGDEAAIEKVTLEQFSSGLDPDCAGTISSTDSATHKRLSLLDAAQSVTGGHLRASKVAERTGIRVGTLVPREDLAVWLFRDFQARRLAKGE